MFRKKWVEILVTDDRTAFFAAKNALEAKNIPYRTDVTDNNLRVSMNTLGAGPGRDGFVKTYYKILVEEKYAPAADILRTGAPAAGTSRTGAPAAGTSRTGAPAAGTSRTGG